MTHAVLLLAGEASGDLHGAALAAELRARLPEVRLLGTGGPRMEAEGVELFAGLDDLSVMGFAEVLPRLRFFRALKLRIETFLDDPAVQLVILIDYPGFNMRIARAARSRGRRVLYYIAPKAWAWRPGRARKLAQVTDRVATILPFEEEFFARWGVRAEYVGHPLLDRIDDVTDEASFRARCGIPQGTPVLALLPGSREQEIERHLDLFVEVAKLVGAARPDVAPVLSRAPNLPNALFEGWPFAVVDDTRALLRYASAALVKSGTATLEAALEGTPSVVTYRTSRATWAVAKAVLRTEHVSLPNLIAGARVVPEYLQGAASPRALADALLPLLDPDSTQSRTQKEGLSSVMEKLGPPGASRRVAELALDLVRRTS